MEPHNRWLNGAKYNALSLPLIKIKKLKIKIFSRGGIVTCYNWDGGKESLYIILRCLNLFIGIFLLA